MNAAAQERHVGDGTETGTVVDADVDINHALAMLVQASNAFPGKSRHFSHYNKLLIRVS